MQSWEKIILLCLVLLGSWPTPASAQGHSGKKPVPVSVSPVSYCSKVWVADQGNGSYRNPILHADYSDPDVIRVGDDFYMTASSFHCLPGLPILHSKDLVNWKIIGHAIQKQGPAEFFDVPQHGYGVWAPCIRYHQREFYIYWGDPDHGVYMVKSKDPAGEWEKPLLVLSGKGMIDPAPFWDEDGKAYLAHGWAASRAGINSMLTMRKMNPEGTQVLDEGRHVFDGHDAHHTVEGPKLYKRKGYYYIFAPAGGVATGWQLALRSRHIYGPYEAKIVLEQGKTSVNGPHQGAWVETPNGQSWFLHFQDQGAYGRIIHLQPVRWEADWPQMGKDIDGNGVGEPVLTHPKPDVQAKQAIQTPAESDEFNSDTLGRQWQWQANPKITWSVLMGKGYLRLFAIQRPVDTKTLWSLPHLLLQKFPAPDFTATTKVDLSIEWETPGKKTGLLVMGNDYAYLAIYKNEKGYQLSQTLCRDAPNQGTEKVIAETPLSGKVVFLRVKVSAPNAHCQFSYSTDGLSFTPIGETLLAQPEKWTGAKVGLFCVSEPGVRAGSYADFDWFRVSE